MKGPRSAESGYNDGSKRKNGDLIKDSRIASQRMENDEMGDRKSNHIGWRQIGSKLRRKD